ncbi:MAG TPA: hypothetical protein VF898_01265 [Chloroflexota bacterium]
MDAPEEVTHSFIVKVWMEDVEAETGSTVWRGRITHVSDGEVRYLKDLNDIPPFIRRYLGGRDAVVTLR